MNSHLNVFKTYTKENRSYQLENDLTRALAICMQEDALFFHEVLKLIFDKSNYFTEFFDDINNTNEISIEIQKKSSDIKDFEHVFATSLSEHTMSIEEFWNQTRHAKYDPICDIVVRINKVVIIIEAKRDAFDCTAQLYNQIYNIFNHQQIPLKVEDEQVTPFDLNWLKLMDIAVKVLSFERSIGSVNRFLIDFVDLVKIHNYKWLPEPALISVSPTDYNAISRRLQSVLNELDKSPEYNKLQTDQRMGLRLNKGWAEEIILNIKNDGSLVMTVYPGNTKSQGEKIFYKDPEFKTELYINGEKYPIHKCYHIKLSGQSYITGLWFDDKHLLENKILYTKENFRKFAGRRKREQWKSVEDLFDQHFNNQKFDWRAYCNWKGKLINSNRTQFDMSFGFELSVEIPFSVLRNIDTSKNDITGLKDLVSAVYHELKEVVK